MISADLLALDYTKATQQLVTFWSRLPKAEGQVCPKHSDFSSSQVNGNLPEIFISEWQDDGGLVVVQAGTVLDRLLGTDMTGLDIFEMTAEALREPEREYYGLLRDTPCAGMLTRSAPNHSGETVLYRTLQLPLLDPYGNVRYFVGTGAVLNKDRAELEYGFMTLGEMGIVSRHFFDIGTGLPAPSAPELKGDHIHFHA
jgi:hypothetical protein